MAWPLLAAGGRVCTGKNGPAQRRRRWHVAADACAGSDAAAVSLVPVRATAIDMLDAACEDPGGIGDGGRLRERNSREGTSSAAAAELGDRSKSGRVQRVCRVILSKEKGSAGRLIYGRPTNIRRSRNPHGDNIRQGVALPAG